MASLNVPLTEGEIIYPASPDEEISEQIDTCFEDEDDEEKAKKTETERRDTKRLMIMEEILETEKNYISCLETLNAVSWCIISFFLIISVIIFFVFSLQRRKKLLFLLERSAFMLMEPHTKDPLVSLLLFCCFFYLVSLILL